MSIVKIQVLSDRHAEGMQNERFQRAEADVLVLAGDIHQGTDVITYARSLPFRGPIVFVPGNHEYWGYSIETLDRQFRVLTQGTNIHFLQQDSVVIADVRFVGCTLWTGFDLFGVERRQAAMDAGFYIDHPIHGANGRPIQPEELRAIHLEQWRYLKVTLSKPSDTPTVVVTHHAPSPRSTNSRYAQDLTSAAYANDYEADILELDPALWLHGHTHQPVDYRIGDTRVISNPRGPDESLLPGYDPVLVVELEL